MEAHLKKIYSLAILVGLIALSGGRQIARADSVVTPFVDSQTNAVIHVDFTSLDMDQVDAWQQKALAGIADPALRAKQQESARRVSHRPRNGSPNSRPRVARIFISWFRWPV